MGESMSHSPRHEVRWMRMEVAHAPNGATNSCRNATAGRQMPGGGMTFRRCSLTARDLVIARPETRLAAHD
jgi:hypothetical protein